MHKQHIIMNVQFSFSFYSSMSHNMKTCRLQDIDRAVSSCRQIKGGRKFRRRVSSCLGHIPQMELCQAKTGRDGQDAHCPLA